MKRLLALHAIAFSFFSTTVTAAINFCGADYSAALNYYGGFYNGLTEPNSNAFSALNRDGTVIAWGHLEYGGGAAPTDTGYVYTASNHHAFASLKADGSISVWGKPEYGGSGGPTDNGYELITSAHHAFAAIKPDGSITAWGEEDEGGVGAPTNNGYVSIKPNDGAFAALHEDGSIFVWGNTEKGGVDGPDGNNFVSVSSTEEAFAALTNEGQVVAWGNPDMGGIGAPTGGGYITLISADSAFVAIKADGSLSSWGDPAKGGMGAPTDEGYIVVKATDDAFAALKNDGSVVSWGDSINGGSGAPVGNDFVTLYANGGAFAVLDKEGYISSWGEPTEGGIGAPTESGFTEIYATNYAFAAMREDGSIRVWGENGRGGDETQSPTGSGYTHISSTKYAFAALTEDGRIEAWGAPYGGGTGAPTGDGYESINSSGPGLLKACDVVPAFSISEVIEDIQGNSNGRSVTVDQLNSIEGVNGAVAENAELYPIALRLARYADRSAPTAQEIQAVIDQVNGDVPSTGALTADSGINVGIGALSVTPLFVLLLLSLAILNNRSRRAKWFVSAASRQNKITMPFLLLALTALPSLSHSSENDRNTGWVFGFGAVISELEPDGTREDYDVLDGSSSGYSLSIAKSINEKWQLMLRYAEPGEASMRHLYPAGDTSLANACVDYALATAAADYLFFSPRIDVSSFLRFGLSHVKGDDSCAGISVSTEEAINPTVGLGVHWALGGTFGLRGVVEYISEDVQLASVSLTSKFGGGSQPLSARNKHSLKPSDARVPKPRQSALVHRCEQRPAIPLEFEKQSTELRFESSERVILALDKLPKDAPVTLVLLSDESAIDHADERLQNNRKRVLELEIPSVYTQAAWKKPASLSSETALSNNSSSGKLSLQIQCSDF